MPSPYPTAYPIEGISATRAFPRIFKSYLADPIDVTVVVQDFHVAGSPRTVQSFRDEVYGRLTAVMKPDTLRIEILRVVGGGELAWAAVESLPTATTKYSE